VQLYIPRNTALGVAALSHCSESQVTDKHSPLVQTFDWRWAPGRRPSVLFTDTSQPLARNRPSTF